MLAPPNSDHPLESIFGPYVAKASLYAYCNAFPRTSLTEGREYSIAYVKCLIP